ncbi:MAG: hypothetical protein HUU38_21175, partial [Anaerolineales bacterium]|nr:hypothetical protein [Anaerolineales bacterium]
KAPGAVASYEDLWRFTLVNYNAGPGCLTYAMRAAWTADRTLIQWDTVKTRFPVGCPYAVQYVDRVTRNRLPGDADFLPPSPTPTQRAYPAPTQTRTPNPSVTVTITLTPTPSPTLTMTPTP